MQYYEQEYDNPRKNSAGIGFTYDELYDAFIPPKPYNSWVFDENTFNWKSSIEMPNDGNYYMWNEENLNWELLPPPPENI